jgi:hypothetical protein
MADKATWTKASSTWKLAEEHGWNQQDRYVGDEGQTTNAVENLLWCLQARHSRPF